MKTLDEARRIYELAPFMRTLGAHVVECAPGRVVAELDLAPQLTQHHGLLHAGVSATLADHTAGAAATTLLEDAGQAVLTVEFKINILRPGRAPRYRCESEVLKPGRRISVVESSVWGVYPDRRELQAKATVTLAVVEAPNGG